MMMQRLFALCLALLLAVAPAVAEAIPTVSDVGLDLMGSSVHYPQLTGLADEEVQAAVNAALLAGGQIEERLNRMAMLLSSPVKLNVTYRYAMVGDVFSCAFLADGAVETSRAAQVWTAVTIDLTTGEIIPLDSLFADAAAARAMIEAYLAEQVAPELSAHLASGALTPLPEVFSIAPEGLTLHYPIEQFRTLSDRAGTVVLRWYELEGLLAPWVQEAVSPAEPTTLDTLTALTAEGSLPGLPVTLDEPMQEVIDRHRLLNDPDIYEGGRMIALEDGAFRHAFVLTDALTESFDRSTVQGLRADRMQLGSLITGVTTLAEWRAALGEPESTLTVDAERADAWRIVPGTSDYYPVGDFRLRLHADETGVLRSIFISR